jgi:hypothetical protein
MMLCVAAIAVTNFSMLFNVRPSVKGTNRVWFRELKNRTKRFYNNMNSKTEVSHSQSL